jgi:hypothetical protein
MKRKRFELVQAPDAKTKDSDQPCAEIANAMPLLQHENAECGPIAGGGMQVLVESTPKEQAVQQDEAIAAKAAEHQRRAVAARKAWVTIWSKKAAAENATAPVVAARIMSENEFRVYLRRIAESNRARFGAARFNGEERVAENGQLMRSAELTADEARYVVQTAHKVSPLARRNDKHACRTNRHRGLRSFQQKRCYENSAMLIAEDDGQRLAYCEGYLRDSTVGVVEHSWVTIGDKVVDLTLRAADQEIGRRNGTTREYFGIVIPREILRKMQNEKQCHGPYLNEPSLWRRIGELSEARQSGMLSS